MSSAKSWLASRWPWLLVAILFGAAQFVYACHLNSLYYSLHAPFYDSMSYLEQWYRTWEFTRMEGVASGMSKAMGGTTALPFVFIPPLAWLLEPSRALAIAYQSLWVVALYFAAADLLRRRAGASPLMSALLPLLFTATTGFWFYNGGISDFRMDLLFYLGFGLSVLRFLAARESGQPHDWAIFGIVCGLVCLGRATAPVFLVLTFAPMLLVSWATGRIEAIGLRRAIYWTTPACILVCGWFYALNWQHLHYYYFVWNSDANAGLPLAESVRHFHHAAHMLGLPMALAGAVLVLLGISGPWWTGPARFDIRGPLRWDWALVFPALVPAGFLALRGAGMNPFVAMPSAFGFSLLLVSVSRAWSFTGWRVIVAALALFGGAFWAASTGGVAHTIAPGDSNRIAGYECAWRLMREAGTRFPEREITTSHLGVAYYSQPALLNWLTYDRRIARIGDMVQADGRSYDLSHKSVLWAGAATLADWGQLPGVSVDEKESALAAILARDVDILVAPDERTAEYFENSLRMHHVNNRVKNLIRLTQDAGDWEKLPEGFSVSPRESYFVWINRSRLADPGPSPRQGPGGSSR